MSQEILLEAEAAVRAREEALNQELGRWELAPPRLSPGYARSWRDRSSYRVTCNNR